MVSMIGSMLQVNSLATQEKHQRQESGGGVAKQWVVGLSRSRHPAIRLAGRGAVTQHPRHITDPAPPPATVEPAARVRFGQGAPGPARAPSIRRRRLRAVTAPAQRPTLEERRIVSSPCPPTPPPHLVMASYPPPTDSPALPDPGSRLIGLGTAEILLTPHPPTPEMVFLR